MTTIKLSIGRNLSSVNLLPADWNGMHSGSVLPIPLYDTNESPTGVSLTEVGFGGLRSDGYPPDMQGYHGWPAEVWRECRQELSSIDYYNVRLEGLPAGAAYTLKVAGWRSGQPARRTDFQVLSADPPTEQSQDVGEEPQPLIEFSGVVPIDGVLELGYKNGVSVAGYLNGFELTYSIESGPTITNVPNMTIGVQATVTGSGFGALAGLLQHGPTAEGPWTAHAVDTWADTSIVITPNLPADGEYYWKITTDDVQEVVGGPNTVAGVIILPNITHIPSPLTVGQTGVIITGTGFGN